MSGLWCGRLRSEDVLRLVGVSGDVLAGKYDVCDVRDSCR